jgi:cytochrome c556
VARSARTIAGHANALPSMFPKGSTAPPSQSKPEVWTRWSAFEAAFKELVEHAAALEKAARSAPATALDETGRVFRLISNNCSACHKAFRKRKK